MRVKHHRRGCGGVAKVRSGGLRGRRTWIRPSARVTCSTSVVIGVVVGMVRMMRVVRMMEVADRCC